ncbi:9453_t:CDS:2, partial [Acaulospora colombiana]
SEESVQQVYRQIESQLGPLDCLVTAAGKASLSVLSARPLTGAARHRGELSSRRVSRTTSANSKNSHQIVTLPTSAFTLHTCTDCPQIVNQPQVRSVSISSVRDINEMTKLQTSYNASKAGEFVALTNLGEIAC